MEVGVAVLILAPEGIDKDLLDQIGCQNKPCQLALGLIEKFCLKKNKMGWAGVVHSFNPITWEAKV